LNEFCARFRERYYKAATVGRAWLSGNIHFDKFSFNPHVHAAKQLLGIGTRADLRAIKYSLYCYAKPCKKCKTKKTHCFSTSTENIEIFCKKWRAVFIDLPPQR
jgi:hypothetical protein